MERFAVVKRHEAGLAKEGFGKTVDATKCGLRGWADGALGETRQLGGRLQPDVLVHGFPLKFEPLFQQRLSGRSESEEGGSERESWTYADGATRLLPPLFSHVFQQLLVDVGVELGVCRVVYGFMNCFESRGSA